MQIVWWRSRHSLGSLSSLTYLVARCRHCGSSPNYMLICRSSVASQSRPSCKSSQFSCQSSRCFYCCETGVSRVATHELSSPWGVCCWYELPVKASDHDKKHDQDKRHIIGMNLSPSHLLLAYHSIVLTPVLTLGALPKGCTTQQVWPVNFLHTWSSKPHFLAWICSTWQNHRCMLSSCSMLLLLKHDLQALKDSDLLLGRWNCKLPVA